MSGKPEAVITITRGPDGDSYGEWHDRKYDKDFFYEEDSRYGWQFKVLNKKNKNKYDAFWKEVGCTQKKS